MAPLIDESNKLNQRTGEAQAFSLIRNLGARTLKTLGWPNKKLESWKYSPTQRFQFEFSPQIKVKKANNNKHPILNHEELIKEYSHSQFHHIITFNGEILFISPSLKSIIELSTLQNALTKDEIDSSSFQTQNDCLEALNISFFDQGFFIKIKENIQIDTPIHVIQTFSSECDRPLFQERIHLQLEPHSQCTVILSEVFLTLKSNTEIKKTDLCWSNNTYLINLDSFAHLNFLHWNELSSKEQITSRTYITLQEQSEIHFLNGLLSEGWCRHDLQVLSKGQNSKIKLHHLGFTQKNGIADQQSKVEFHSTQCEAEQICKNLLLDESHVIFNGCLHIHPKAQKTNASQLHQNLLLSEKAEVDTKPQLEIFADDVKATHGATIGQLNQDEVFYLQSRGLSKERASALLSQSFLIDLCERFSNNDIKMFLTDRLNQFWERSKS